MVCGGPAKLNQKVRFLTDSVKQQIFFIYFILIYFILFYITSSSPLLLSSLTFLYPLLSSPLILSAILYWDPPLLLSPILFFHFYPLLLSALLFSPSLLSVKVPLPKHTGLPIFFPHAHRSTYFFFLKHTGLPIFSLSSKD